MVVGRLPGQAGAFGDAAQRQLGPSHLLQRRRRLQGHAYGAGFRYDERVSCGPGEEGLARAEWFMRATSLDAAAHQPKPGEGPSLEEREAGSYDLLFAGLTAAGERLDLRVRGDRDPGYGSTSKIIADTAC